LISQNERIAVMQAKATRWNGKVGNPGGRKKIRVLLTKSRMDAHDRGIRYVAKELSNAGMEVILTRYGLPDEIVRSAVQESVDVIGVSCSTGGHLYVAEVIQNCQEKERFHGIKLIFGGVIPQSDLAAMKSRGVAAVFGPGSSVKEIIQAIL
jgi:methylmalonyl-CoA mutase C-terminal domain/subunit